MYDTDKVEGGLIMLFFSLVFSIAPIPPENFFADTLVYLCSTEFVLFPRLPFVVFKTIAVVLCIKHRVMQCSVKNPRAPQAYVSK